MECKKLKIETNGTTVGTKVYVDGKQIGRIHRIVLSADVDSKFVTLSIEKQRTDASGKTITTKTRVRDESSQKFVEVEKIAVEPLQLEFVK